MSAFNVLYIHVNPNFVDFKIFSERLAYVMVLASNEMSSVAELRGARGMRPHRVQILSISCSFRGNLAKLYVGAPHLGEILDPPLVIDECCWVPFALGDNNTDF